MTKENVDKFDELIDQQGFAYAVRKLEGTQDPVYDDLRHDYLTAEMKLRYYMKKLGSKNTY